MFDGDTFNNGIWIYKIITDADKLVGVTLKKEAFSTESVTLGYDDMPYEKLIDTEDNEYLTVSYKDAFKKLPSGVTALTINNWTNRNIMDMSYMFNGCSAMTALDLNNFNTANVENMSLMFYECYLMKELTGTNNWNTSKVQTLNNTFGRCMALVELDLSGWDLSAITDAYNMFTSCDKLEAIHVNESVYETFIPMRYDTGIVFEDWFYRDKSLLPTLQWDQVVSSSEDTTIMITAFASIVYNGTFDTLESSTPPYFINGIYRYSVFEYPTNDNKRIIGAILDDKTISKLDIPESVSPASFVMDSKNELLPVSIFDNILSFAESLTFVNVSEWDIKNVVDMSNLFCGCKALMDIKGLGEWDIKNVVDMSCMFGGCSMLQSLSLAKWVLKDGIRLESMFAGCNRLIILTIPLNMAKQFYNLSATIRLPFNTWYYGTTQISNAVLDSISSSVVTFTKDPTTVLYYDSTFPTTDTSFTKYGWQYKIYKSTLYDDDPDDDKPAEYRPAFIEARLTTEALSAGTTPSSLPVSVITDTDFASLPVMSMKQAFMGSMATSIVINGWNAYFINDMSGMFSGCLVLKSATLKGLVKSNITTLYAMFAFCSSLMTLDLSDWTVNDDTNIDEIFSGCTALTRVKLSKGGARLLSKLPAPADGVSWRVVHNNTQTELTDLKWNNAWGEGAKWFVCYPISADKTLTGVTFTDNTYTNGMWTYTLGDDGISLSINESGLPEISNGTLTLNYDHMPYEKLVMTDKTTYVTMSYKDAFAALPDTVTTLIVNNWTNRTIYTMESMFDNCDVLKSITLNSFDTFGVENMKTMFYNCSSLETLTLGDKFDTLNVTDMTDMFEDCAALSSMSLYKASNSIIKELPSATWTVKNNESDEVNKVTVSEGVSASWTYDEPATWTLVPWTLSRTIQS